MREAGGSQQSLCIRKQRLAGLPGGAARSVRQFWNQVRHLAEARRHRPRWWAWRLDSLQLLLLALVSGNRVKLSHLGLSFKMRTQVCLYEIVKA